MAVALLSGTSELRGQGGSASSSPVDPFTKVNKQQPEQSAGIFSGVRCDPLAIRRKFPDRWSAFLRSHFRDHVEVAYVFSVDEKTARHWWAGTTGPQGWAVDFAHRAFPEAREWVEAAA